jgi:hypothetical protein
VPGTDQVVVLVGLAALELLLRHCVPIALAVTTGCVRGEILGLQWQDV